MIKVYHTHIVHYSYRISGIQATLVFWLPRLYLRFPPIAQQHGEKRTLNILCGLYIA